MTAGRAHLRPPCVLLAEEVWGSTLHAMRSLDRAGVPVLVASVGDGSKVYRRSRHCTAAIDLAVDDTARAAEQLRSWVDSEVPGPDGPVVVIPLSDRLVELLHRERPRFDERFRLAIPEPDVAEALLDKERSFELAARAGLDVPAWVTVGSEEDVARTDAIPLPAIVRPTSWATTGTEYFKVAVASSRGDLRRVVRRSLGRGARLVVQEYLEGPDDAVEFGIVWRSRLTARTVVCTGRKRRQSSPEGGVMAWGEAIELPDVAEHAEAFLEASGYRGLGGIELIRRGEELSFVEFNPRLEAIHFLAAAAGVDTVLMEYEELALGTSPPWSPVQHPAAAWLGSAWLSRLRTDTAAWRAVLRDRVEFQRSPVRVRAVWTARDPGPGLAVAARLLARLAASPSRDEG